MNEKYKKRMPKFLPVGIAMGVLFSASPLASPLTENTVKADVGTFGTVVTTFGNIYDKFLKEPLGKWLEEIDVKSYYYAEHENLAYKAPTFQKGEFGISAFSYYKDKDFSKKVKIAYANGQVEYKTIKHGEQIRIKDANTMVDLTPDKPELSGHDILYITQNLLDAGNKGVSLTNFKTYYLQSDNSGRRNTLGDKYLKQEFPHYYPNGLRVWGVDEDELFKKLPVEKQILGTITSEPISETLLYASADIDYLSAHHREFGLRDVDLLTQHKDGEYSSLSTKIKGRDGFIRSWNDGSLSKSDGNTPLDRQDFTITPIKKGSNKVFLRAGSQYIPSELGNNELYLIDPSKVWTLHDTGMFGTFVLQNDKGQYLSVDHSSATFTDQYDKASVFTADLKEDEWNNWLNKWYPGK
ncbi:hypothetical protein [Bacillus pseudomycoides]|uniref:hypothetical protein n=1 Tax=Bacillus pseudomycoides TaxID=64104 RepID=UPI000BEBE1D3|nr:hypothetical protein [Bacillus pseudomycoides]PDX99429.1 hypothetical protein COO07_16610 [Bacillus pseudomycoides]PEK73409.1 hypothetical protein CN597_29390 [Bacillus pseudomycoides]PEN10139.1 hypothetical protein CN640_09295 [Bacillus pseudomycoides]